MLTNMPSLLGMFPCVFFEVIGTRKLAGVALSLKSVAGNCYSASAILGDIGEPCITALYTAVLG